MPDSSFQSCGVGEVAATGYTRFESALDRCVAELYTPWSGKQPGGQDADRRLPKEADDARYW
jgi:hypothetical protein